MFILFVLLQRYKSPVQVTQKYIPLKLNPKHKSMKYIIFDIDGTLTNTKKVDDKCFIKAFQRTFNIDIENFKWEDLEHVTDWGITEEMFKQENGRVPNKAEYELMMSNFVSILNEERESDKSQFNEVSGAKDFFNSIRKSTNFKLGIATGAWEASAKIKLNAVGIDLEGISFSNSDYHKSREAITQDVIKQINIKTQRSPDQIIYFGDGVWDYKTCKNLGIQFIGIDVAGDGKLSKIGAKTVFHNYNHKEQILTVLNKMM